MTRLRPVVGNWYKDAEMGAIFEVVAYDEHEESVEVQHLDGEVEEYDLDTWHALRLALVAPPEDWRSGFELSSEDASDPDDTQHPEDWSGAINQIEPDEIGIEDDWQE
jgi:hypothetical protein